MPLPALRVRVLASLLALVSPVVADAQVTLVTTGGLGYYNNSIGNSLNLSNTGFENCTEPFPVSNDNACNYAAAPNLSAASGALGNWLTNPLSLNANWSGPQAIPNSWAVGTEVAVIYQFNTLGATNVQASFGVDNGIYAWLDGNYIFGARGPGSTVAGEYQFALGNLASGTHFLQLILEDHGSVNGYSVEIKADEFIPGPDPRANVVPEPSTYALMASGLVGLFVAARRRRVS